jgi:uncharacterized protein (DUF1330 family)
VLREFPDYSTALACYRSAEYQRAKPLRLPHSVCDFVIIEGYDGAQPQVSATPPASATRKGYWIGHVDLTDPEGYKAYTAANSAPLGKFGGRFLVRGGGREVVGTSIKPWRRCAKAKPSSIFSSLKAVSRNRSGRLR